MSENLLGIKNPTEKQCEKAKTGILKSTYNYHDLDPAKAWDELQQVLRNANTIINFHNEQEMNEELSVQFEEIDARFKTIEHDLRVLEGKLGKKRRTLEP
jgi:hypothetical protein